MKIKRGSTSVRRLIFIADSSSTTGAGLTNLTHASSGLVAYYFAGDLNNEVQITLASATLGTFTSGGFVAVDNTNMPGWYEIGIPDAALDGGNEVAIQLRGATNMVPVNIYIELDAVDYQSATSFGLSRLDADVSSRLASASYSAPPSASTVASQVRTELTTELGRIDATVSSRLASASYTAPPSSSTITTDVWAAATRTITGGTITTVSDKTGYSLSVTPPTATDIANQVRTELTTELGRIDASVSSRLASASYTAPDNASITAIKAKTDSLTFTVAGFVDCNLYRWRGTQPGTLDANSFVPANTAAINGNTTRVGTLATALDNDYIAAIKTKTDNLPTDPADASDIASSFSTVNTKLDAIDDYMDTELAAVKGVTDKLDTAMILDGAVYQFTANALELAPTGGGGGLDAAGVRAAVGLASANLDTQFAAIPTSVWANATRSLTTFGTLVSDVTAAVWAAATRTLTAVSDSSGVTTLLSRVVGTLASGTHNPQSGDAFARLGAPSGASIAADIGTRLAASSYTSPPSASTVASQVRTELATELGRIDVATSTRLASGSYAAPDNAAIAAIKAKTDNLPSDPADQSLLEAAITAATSPLSLQSTLLTGLGYIDTEVASIKSVTDKLDTTMEQDGTAYRFTANALEMVPVAETGTGARVVTIMVDDGADPIEGVVVRMSRIGQTVLGRTNASGVAIFSVDDATWTVSLTAPSFAFSPATLVVDGNETVTYSMTPITIPPSSPDTVTGYWTILDADGNPFPGMTVHLRIVSFGSGSTGLAQDDEVRTAVADANGVASFTELFPGAVYNVWLGSAIEPNRITVPANATGTVALGSIVG